MRAPRVWVGVDMFHWADAGACQQLLTDAGFEPATRRDVELRWTTDDGPQAMMHSLDSGGVRSRALFKARRAEAKAAIAADIAASLTEYEEHGTCVTPLDAFIVTADKSRPPTRRVHDGRFGFGSIRR